MNEEQAVELIGLLVAAFPTPAWEKPTIRLWREELVDLDHRVTDTVVREWIRTHDQRPSIAAIRRGVADKQLGNLTGGKLFLPPDEAWEYVQRHFGITGQYREFPDEHPLVKQAVERMGWIAMCRSDNLDVLRGQFRMAYTPLLERSLAESAASEGAASAPLAVGLEHQPPKIPTSEPLRIARVRS